MFPSPSMSASFISSCISFAYITSLKKKQISPLGKEPEHWTYGSTWALLSLSISHSHNFHFKPGTQKGRVFHRAFVEPVFSCGFNYHDKKRDKAPLSSLAPVWIRGPPCQKHGTPPWSPLRCLRRGSLWLWKNTFSKLWFLCGMIITSDYGAVNITNDINDL